MQFPNRTSEFSPDRDDRFARWFEARRTVVLTISIVFALAWAIVFLQFTVDDAFINLRYGQNLVLHHIWNWNPSGNHEEAYSSPVFAALGVLPMLLGLSPALFFKGFGLACVGAILYRLRTLAASPFAVLLGTLLLALHPYVAMHTFSGLETTLYMLLLLEIARCVLQAPTVSALWVYVLFLLIPLIRPEGIVFSCAGVALFWRNRGAAQRHIAGFAIAVLAGLSYFLARWHYFHHFLPNPFYAKIGNDPWRSLLSTTANQLLQYDMYFFILIVLFLLARNTLTRVFAACALLLLLLLCAPHELAMNYADRYYFQLALPIFLLFLITEDPAHVSRIATVIASLFLLAISPAALIYGITCFPVIKRTDIDLGQRLAPFARDHVLVVGEAGALPYYSRWVTYDFLGLGTNSFASARITVPQLQQIRPDLILAFVGAPGPHAIEDPANPGPRSTNAVFLKYLRQSNEYHYAAASRGSGYYLAEFLRDDTPHHDEILAALQQNAQTSANTHLSFRTLLLQRYVPWRH